MSAAQKPESRFTMHPLDLSLWCRSCWTLVPVNLEGVDKNNSVGLSGMIRSSGVEANRIILPWSLGSLSQDLRFLSELEFSDFPLFSACFSRASANLVIEVTHVVKLVWKFIADGKVSVEFSVLGLLLQWEWWMW